MALLITAASVYADVPSPAFSSCEIWATGVVSYNQDSGFGTTVASTPMLLYAAKGTTIEFPEGSYEITLTFYDKDGLFLSQSEQTAPTYTAAEDTYYRVQLTGTEALSEETFKSLNSFARKNYTAAEQYPSTYESTKLINNTFMFYPTGVQDGILVGDELWMFVSSTLGGKEQIIYKVNPKTGEEYEAGAHDLGHCNTVDYLEENDTLVTIENLGSGDFALILYGNVSKADKLLIAGEDAMMINFSSADGTDSNINAVFKDATHLYFTLTCRYGAQLQLIELGTGAEDLSVEENGAGTFTEADEGAYNGTFRVVKEYTGAPIGVSQGMCCDGENIYMSHGHSRLAIQKITVDDVNDTYTIEREYVVAHPSETNKYYNCKIEPETLVIRGGVLYYAALESGGHLGAFVGKLYPDACIGGSSYALPTEDAFNTDELTIDSDVSGVVYVNCMPIEFEKEWVGLVPGGETIVYIETDAEGGKWIRDGLILSEDKSLIFNLYEDMRLEYVQ